MLIEKDVTIHKSVDEVWEVLGNQFGEIDKWSSLISKSEVSGEATIPGLPYSIRTTDTAKGVTQQQMKSFDPEKHTLSYAAIKGTPFFIKNAVATWSAKKVVDSSTNLNLHFEVELAGIMGAILGPVAKKKLGKLGDELMDDLKYYVENGKPHARKLAAVGRN